MAPLQLGHQLLVLNAGSSSLKYAVFTAATSTLKRIVNGIAEGIGTATQARFKHCEASVETAKDVDLPDHRTALKLILNAVRAEGIVAVGHRVVHGGEKFSKATLVDTEVLREISAASSLAPMHNPWNVLGIEVSLETLGEHPQVAVFDTAFHQTMPQQAYMYALPYSLYEKHSIRKYGFHGTSYQYVLGQAAAALGKPVDKVNLIVCHLGSGASMCAIKEGKCIDTTMGLTPLEGLVMGTRCGDLDPAIPLHLIKLGYTVDEVTELLNKQSGLLGVSGTQDNRDVEAAYRENEPLAVLAKKMQVYRARKYLGAYIVALEGCVDALVFTGGIGENSHLHRQLVCEGLERLGIELDLTQNEVHGGRFASSTRLDTGSLRSNTQIWVIPTDEELSIAQQTATVLASMK